MLVGHRLSCFIQDKDPCSLVENTKFRWKTLTRNSNTFQCRISPCVGLTDNVSLLMLIVCVAVNTEAFLNEYFKWKLRKY